MRTIYERLDDILPKITDPAFRENKGMGNEVGYYIRECDFSFSFEFGKMVNTENILSLFGVVTNLLPKKRVFFVFS